MSPRSAHWSDPFVLGLLGALIAIFAGAWTAAAPFVFAYQPQDADWVKATQVGVATGIGLGVAGLLAAAMFAAGLRAQITALADEAEADTDDEGIGYGQDDLDRAMAEVTTQLLAELRSHQSSRASTHTARERQALQRPEGEPR